MQTFNFMAIASYQKAVNIDSSTGSSASEKKPAPKKYLEVEEYGESKLAVYLVS